MKANKLIAILKQRNITLYGLNELMKKKGYPSVNCNSLKHIILGKKQITCTIGKRSSIPSLLQRICETLEIKSSDIIEYQKNKFALLLYLIKFAVIN